jgi:hypothetical protein
MKPFIPIGIVFAISFAVALGSRLSEDVVTLLVGLVCGISMVIPFAIIYAISQIKIADEPQTIVMVFPNYLPTYGNLSPTDYYNIVPNVKLLN